MTHGAIGCAIWLNDQAPRPPRALADDEVLDLGGRRVRRLDTPHVPHCWDAGLLYEETTGTLFTSDLFTHAGDPAALTDGDITGPAMEAEKQFGYTALTPAAGATIRRLARLEPRTLAVMHGSSYSGAGAPVLETLAGFYDGPAAERAVAPSPSKPLTLEAPHPRSPSPCPLPSGEREKSRASTLSPLGRGAG